MRCRTKWVFFLLSTGQCDTTITFVQICTSIPSLGQYLRFVSTHIQNLINTQMFTLEKYKCLDLFSTCSINKTMSFHNASVSYTANWCDTNKGHNIYLFTPALDRAKNNFSFCRFSNMLFRSEIFFIYPCFSFHTRRSESFRHFGVNGETVNCISNFSRGILGTD